MTTFLVVMDILIVLLIISLFVCGYYAFTKILKEFLDISTTLAACNKSIMNGCDDVKNQIGELIKAMHTHSDAAFNRHKIVIEVLSNINTILKAPIDKINDTHNRIKTLGKGTTSTDELRDIVGNVVGDIAREAVDDAVNRLTKKPKTTKKVTKEPIKEGKL